VKTAFDQLVENAKAMSKKRLTDSVMHLHHFQTAAMSAILLASTGITAGGFAAEIPFGGKGIVACWSFEGDDRNRAIDQSAGDNDAKVQCPEATGRVASPFAAQGLAIMDSTAGIIGPDKGFPAGKKPVSISLWLNVPAGTRDKVLLCYGSPVRGQARGLWLVNEKRLCFYFWGHPQDLHANLKSGIVPNRWHCVVATYDGGTARLYYNGDLVGEGKADDIDTVLRGRFQLGANLNADGKELLGMVDEVVVLDRVLTAEEIQVHYKKGVERIAASPRGRLVIYDDLVRARRESQAKEMRDALLDFEEIVFTVRQPGKDGHWYANFSHRCEDPSRVLYGDGGKLCALNVNTGTLRMLLSDPKGGVRDPQMHYDGKKILFSYRKGGQPYYHLYEINVDGTGLRRLTDGPFDDFEPTYLPDGGIVFCSSRVKCNVPCYYTRVAVLYRCDADGSNIHRLSSNVEHENTPWVLPDGRILYQRWEYVDRSQVRFHHLWTSNPDGTGQMVFFGNMLGNGVLIDAKPIPNSNRVITIHSPGHGRREHEGFVELVDPRGGPDCLQNVRRITARPEWRDPYPLSEQTFLVAGPGHHQISLLDARAKSVPLLTLESDDVKAGMWVHEPRPMRGRRRERIIPPRADQAEETGTVVLRDVYFGRSMKGVRRGEIKKLLVLELLHMPVKPNRDWQQMVSFDGNEGGSFSLERIVGTVPVEEDGSAYFQVPALRPLFFVALDENDLSVKRMQSFMTVQPGESVGCVGCHEHRMAAPPATRPMEAMARPASRIEPVEDIPFVFDYPRDIQPILDKHCVGCHGYEKTRRGGPYAGKVMLSGARGIFYHQSYAALRARKQVADGFNGAGNRPPRTIGTSASPLMKKLDGAHHKVKLTEREKNRIRYWIESAGTFAGTYAALGKGFIMPHAAVVPGDVHRRRCTSCHDKPMPTSKDDPRTHWLYNLDDPAKSVVLLAPLVTDAGGWGLCSKKPEAGEQKAEEGGVFPDTTDPDYERILAEVRKLAEALDRNKRYDMPGFQPHPAYVREMKFFGVLPPDFQWTGPADMFTTDRAYWQSLQRRPATKTRTRQP